MAARASMTPVDWLDNVARLFSGMRTMIQERNRMDGRGFSECYSTFKLLDGGPSSAGRLPENKDKNRYKNILPYDSTRVVLEHKKKKKSDYINANWIPGANGPRSYVASQGPVPLSFNDFWSMIWQNNIETIVMTTREVEGGKMKCHRYWPDPTSKPPKKKMKTPECVVTFVSTEQVSNYTIRVLELSHKKVKRRVTQICYETWPDHGVPISSDEFLHFRDRVESIQKAQSDPSAPLCIHCSAGVGRTGTFIAIDSYLHMLHNGASPDVDAIIAGMRRARNHMVQTEVQYLFIWKTILDALRDSLGDAATTGATGEVIDEAEAQAEAHDIERAAERKEIKELLESDNSTVWAGASAEEVFAAEMAWAPDEEFDVLKALTPLQSRLESLNTKGIIVKQATAAETAALVGKVKAYREKKAAEEAAREAEAEAELAAKEAEDAAAAAAGEKKEAKRRQSKEASKFMRRMSLQ